MLKVTLNDVKKAQETIKGVVKETPVLESKTLSEMTGANVFYKCENLQKTGSFKVRGAVNTIANLTDAEKANGVIASSAGNHAQGVALGAQMTGIKATIVMPATAPLAKVSPDKKVVLGLITTKTPELEDKKEVIERIHEAAKYIPLERLCLSPQCGFASCEIGNKLTEEQQWAKLKLVKEIAEEVWG